MQAMPTIPADPINAGKHAESRPAVEGVSDDQFSQHLATASNNIDNSDKNLNKRLPTSVDKDIPEPEDENGINTDVIPAILQNSGEVQLALVSPMNQQTSLPDFTSTSSASSTFQQNTRFPPLTDSIKVQDTTVYQSAQKNQPTPLESLLDITKNSPSVISGNEQTSSTVSKPSSDQTPPAITVENWRAQFSYQSSRADIQVAHNLKPGAGQVQLTGQGSLQEPVLAYTAPEVDTGSRTTHPSHGTGINFPNQPRDANSNYIHSTLPGINVKTEGEENKNTAQQNGDGQKNLAQGTLSQQELATTPKSSQDTPLIFSLDQEKATGLMPQSQTTSTSLMLRLPSGTEVPQSHIMNQVIDRFTLNRTLESGSITLKLYPEELGELRMEIKVEQDNIKAHITTQNPQVQEILDRHLPRLREALEQQGLNLEQMKVTVAAGDDSSGQLFQEHFGNQQPKPSQQSNTDRLAFSLDHPLQDESEVVDKNQNLSVLA